jgi:hypothetical protein
MASDAPGCLAAPARVSEQPGRPRDRIADTTFRHRTIGRPPIVALEIQGTLFDVSV